MFVIQTSFPETGNTVFTFLLNDFRWNPKVFCSKFQINESGHKILRKPFSFQMFIWTRKRDFGKSSGEILENSELFWSKSQTDLKSLRVFHKKMFFIDFFPGQSLLQIWWSCKKVSAQLRTCFRSKFQIKKNKKYFCVTLKQFFSKLFIGIRRMQLWQPNQNTLLKRKFCLLDFGEWEEN